MINEIFKNTKVNLDKLLKYGFKKNNNYYEYSTNIMNNSFKIIVRLKNNNITSKIYDINFNEEYTNINIKDNSYANKVRNEYIIVLNDIKNKCFDTYYYNNDQTNRIVKYIENNFNDKPEFLWERYPKFGIFRNKNNKKWYALIMELNGNEIMNLKINELELDELLKKDGYKEAYHMNKKKWITLILDNTLSDEEIIKHIEYSYNVINKGVKK